MLLYWCKQCGRVVNRNAVRVCVAIGAVAGAAAIGAICVSWGNGESQLATEVGPIWIGMVEVGKSHSQAFVLRNECAEGASIVGSRTSCGCLSFNSDIDYLAPGSVQEVFCEIDAGRPGPVSQTLWIDTDSNLLGSLRFDFAGIARGIWADKRVVEFGEVEYGQRSVRKVIVFIAGFPSGQIDTIRCADSRFQVTKREVSASEAVRLKADRFGLRKGLTDGTIRAWELDIVWVAQGGAVGRLSSVLSVESRAAGAVELLVSCTANRVRVIPGKLVFNGMKVGEEQIRDVALLFGNGKPSIAAKEIAVVSDSEFVKTSIVQIDGEIRIACRACVDTKSPRKIIQGKITGMIEGEQLFTIPYVLVMGR